MKLGSKKPTAKKTFVQNTDQAYPNRAEEVRSRRAQRSKERVSSVSSRVSTPPPPTRPVIVRGGAFGKPIHQQAQTRARRQFYVTMDRAAGTELRLPAIPLPHPSWRLASGLLAILMAFGIFTMWNSSYCLINTVQVKGLQRLSVDDINAVVSLENLSIIAVDPGQVQQKLIKTYPELTNIHIRVELPNVVTISAGERTPVLALVKGDHTDWVDASGYIFPVRGEVPALVTIQANDGLPLVPTLPDDNSPAQQEADGLVAGASVPTAATDPAAPPKPKIVDPTTLKALQELSKVLPPETQLVFSKQHGLGWKAPEGWQVFIGSDLRQFEEKYNMYQQLTSYMVAKGITPALVDVENLNAPYYRLEQ